MENIIEMDDSWPWAPGMEYKHVDVSWLFDFSRPTTVLHNVILLRIAEERVRQEEERQQQSNHVLFIELQKVMETNTYQFYEPNVLRPERYEQVSKFDLWQREVAKHLKLLLHNY